MSKQFLEMDGVIEKVLPNTRFIIILKNNVKVEGYISGKLRKHYIKILKGDKVRVEISPYDLSKGRIILRYKNKNINDKISNQ